MLETQSTDELFTLADAQAAAEQHAQTFMSAFSMIEGRLGQPGRDTVTLDWWDEQEPMFQHSVLWFGRSYELELRHTVSGLEQIRRLVTEVRTSRHEESV